MCTMMLTRRQHLIVCARLQVVQCGMPGGALRRADSRANAGSDALSAPISVEFAAHGHPKWDISVLGGHSVGMRGGFFFPL
jgi:hypothetical protein